MGERDGGGVRILVDPLTSDAPDCRARAFGRGERSHRRQGGGVAVRPDPRIAHVARAGPLLRPPPRGRRALATSPPLDGDTHLPHAPGATPRDAVTRSS